MVQLIYEVLTSQEFWLVQKLNVVLFLTALFTSTVHLQILQ